MKADNSSETTETDWERLDGMADSELDYSDIPPLGDRFFADARVFMAEAAADERTLTARRMYASDFIGIWSDRTDLGDSTAYARGLRRQAEMRSGE